MGKSTTIFYKKRISLWNNKIHHFSHDCTCILRFVPYFGNDLCATVENEAFWQHWLALATLVPSLTPLGLTGLFPRG